METKTAVITILFAIFIDICAIVYTLMHIPDRLPVVCIFSGIVIFLGIDTLRSIYERTLPLPTEKKKSKKR